MVKKKDILPIPDQAPPPGELIAPPSVDQPVFERAVMDSPASEITPPAGTASGKRMISVDAVELNRLLFALLTARTNHITRMGAMRVASNLTGFTGVDLQAFMDQAKQQCIGGTSY